MSKQYYVFLDDGHGMETAGKRTPKFSDGSFMHENEFNSVVANKVEEKLRGSSNVNIVQVAPGNKDVSLSNRVNTANKVYKDACNKYGKSNVVAIYVSIHANAYKSVWGDWGGIETFFYPSSTSKDLSSKIHKELVKGTVLRDRGLKDGSNLYVLRNTTMPATLVECGFMDNLKEANLLKSNSYREECASEIVTGICNYLNIKISNNNTSNNNGNNTNSKIGIVNTDVLNVRDGRGTNYKIIGKLKRNEKVKLCYLMNNWWSIDYGASVGYVSADYISIK